MRWEPTHIHLLGAGYCAGVCAMLAFPPRLGMYRLVVIIANALALALNLFAAYG